MREEGGKNVQPTARLRFCDFRAAAAAPRQKGLFCFYFLVLVKIARVLGILFSMMLGETGEIGHVCSQHAHAASAGTHRFRRGVALEATLGGGFCRKKMLRVTAPRRGPTFSLLERARSPGTF